MIQGIDAVIAEKCIGHFPPDIYPVQKISSLTSAPDLTLTLTVTLTLNHNPSKSYVLNNLTLVPKTNPSQ